MRTPLLVALALALTTVPAVAAAQPSPGRGPSLDALLERFAAAPGMEARFREEKRIALLALPTRSEGRIHFAAPDRMIRRTVRPEASAALIADGQLRMRQGDRVEVLDIDSNPVLRGFVDSFRAVLAGDRAALRRFYEAELSAREGEPDGWELRLRPRDERLRRFLREIRMEGAGVTIRSMRMIEVNGDETRTEFYDVDTNRRYTPSEARRIFRIE